MPNDPWMPRPAGNPAGTTEHCGPWVRDGFVSVQVNVDANGCNIVGDAANEPSIAIDAVNPNNIVIGWRQFDTILSDFRQAGWGYSHDAGRTWTFPGVLEPGVFRTDPVLDSDAEGNLYYLSMVTDADITFVYCDLWKSADGGVTWGRPVYAYGGDKPWFAIDKTPGPGHGNLYAAWDYYSCCGNRVFTRSTNGGGSFMPPTTLPGEPIFGTVAVGPDGEVYISGVTAKVLKSLNARDAGVTPTFMYLGDVALGGSYTGWGGPNPGGLLGQSWIACDHSGGSSRGYVYVLTSVRPDALGDPLDVMFARSVDGGTSWSRPVRVNDDPRDNGAWQWFGTLAVAPNGRIDVVWNDTRNDPTATFSELYYSFSINAGRTWARNVAVSLPFNHYLGYPQQSKLGDYYHMISDDLGASVAYAATFNGEQDVYFLRVPFDCNGNGLPDSDEILDGALADVDENLIPDECESDIDNDGLMDRYDPDIDNDGVANYDDRCPFGPPGVRARTDGSPYGDGDGNCSVDLADYRWYQSVYACFSTSGPFVPSPNRVCRGGVDFDADGDVDLQDVAVFQRIFGLSGG